MWDLDTQHCCQTVVGQRGEVWALDVDSSETRLATGSADGELRLYQIVAEGEEEEGEEEEAAGEAGEGGGRGRAERRGEVLRPLGSVRRSAPERAAVVRFSGGGGVGGAGGAGGALLACASAGKVVEVWRVRSEAEAAKRLKRRRKRRREKSEKKAAGTAGAAGVAGGAAEGEEGEEGLPDTISASDELEPLTTLRSKHKLRAFAYCPAGGNGGGRRGAGHVAQLVLALANNSLEVGRAWSGDAGGDAVPAFGG